MMLLLGAALGFQVRADPHLDRIFQEFWSAEWALDEGQGVSVGDSTGGGRDGRLVNDPAWVDCGSRKVLSFDGRDDYVDVARAGDLPSGGALKSICAWARHSGNGQGQRCLVSFGSPSTGGALFIGMRGSALHAGGINDDLLVDGMWDSNRWHHVALTFDGKIAKVYFDGRLAASMEKSWSPIPRLGYIGRQVNGSDYWLGQICGIGVYGRILREEEIAALAKASPLIVARARLPLPSPARQQDISKEIRKTFSAEYARKRPEDRYGFSRRLLDLALQEVKNPEVQYALFCEAIEIASQTCEAHLAMESISSLSRRFEVDELRSKSETLLRMASIAKGVESIRRIAHRCLEVSADLGREEDYEGALNLAAKAAILGRGLKDPSVTTRADELAATYRDLRREYESVRTHAKKLLENAEDPAANLALGRFYCFHVGDWDKGLPFLARGDERLRAHVERESKRSADPASVLQLASEWWDFGAKSTYGKLEFQARAVFWYWEAARGLGTLEATRVKGRVDSLARVAPSKIDRVLQDHAGSLPPDRLVKLVNHRLMELNPGFDGVTGGAIGTGASSLQYRIEGDRVIEFSVSGKPLRDISPLRAFRHLEACAIRSKELVEIAPLKGLKLRHVELQNTSVKDVSCLVGMPLERVNLDFAHVRDVLPLGGAPLKVFRMLGGPGDADLRGLAGCPLEEVVAPEAVLRSAMPVFANMKTLKIINDKPSAEFWEGR